MLFFGKVRMSRYLIIKQLQYVLQVCHLQYICKYVQTQFLKHYMLDNKKGICVSIQFGVLASPN